MAVPNPEQTSSIAVFLTYVWLDPTIWHAYRVKHLPHDELPPLCDYDEAKNLIKRAYPVRLIFLHELSMAYSIVLSHVETRPFLWRPEEVQPLLRVGEDLQTLADPASHTLDLFRKSNRDAVQRDLTKIAQSLGTLAVPIGTNKLLA